MRPIIGTRNLTVALGVSLIGVSGYLLYLLFKKDEDDDYLETIPKTSTFKISEVNIPKDHIRDLIGRNGRTIKSIEHQSKTKIHFKDQNDKEEHRTCVIKGTKENCAYAENLIFEYISKQPVIESLDIFVPQYCVGKIIGRCGENIMELVNRTGAKIKVSDEDRTTPTRRIIVKGLQDQVKLAKSYIEEIVERTQAQQSEIDLSLSKREPRVPPKSTSPNLKGHESPKCERISPIPGQPDSQFEVYVSAMVDPSRFWLQIVGPKATQLDTLVEEMTEYYSKTVNQENHALTSFQKGDLVAATFQYDNKWYRAEILNIDESDNADRKAELYYVDYGDTDMVSCDKLFELRTDFLRLHFQAIECYLARVEPPNGAESWPEEAVDKFEEWTYVAQWKKLSAHLNGCCSRERTRAKREGSPVPGVDLYDVNGGQDLDIAEELVKQGFAAFKKDEMRSSSRSASHHSSVDSL